MAARAQQEGAGFVILQANTGAVSYTALYFRIFREATVLISLLYRTVI